MKVVFQKFCFCPRTLTSVKGVTYTVGWVAADENKVTSKKPKLVSSLICILCKGGGGISPPPLVQEGAQGGLDCPKRKGRCKRGRE